MSKGKRTARAEAPAPRERRHWLWDAERRVRAGWLLAVSLLAYVLAALALRRGLGAALAALFDAWGLNASTALRAPTWARLFWRWQGSAITAIVSAALLGLSALLRRLWGLRKAFLRFSGKAFALYAALGLCLAALVLLLCLIPDSIRLDRSALQSHPSLIALCALSLLTALAEEAFTKGVLYDGLDSRWGALWAMVVTCAVFFLSNGGYAGNVPCAINVALMSLLCCRVYAKAGLWAAVGLRWSWSFVTVFLMGFGGGEASLARFYGVSEALFTGGDAGPIYGLWLTLALLTALAWTERNEIRVWMSAHHRPSP